MYKTENLFKNTINEIQNLWKTNKNLSKFVSWPQDLKFTNAQNKRIAVTDKLSSWNINDQSSNSKIHKLISNLSQDVRWESGYYEKDVCFHFKINSCL